MSLYADYLKEHSGDNIVEYPNGFATYRFLNDRQCYLVDIYVAPDWRKKRYASEMANEICAKAKSKGCEELLGSVSIIAKDPTASMKVLLAYGMTFSHVDGNLIIFKKDII